MIRPEAARALHRWREGLVGAALVLLGLYWIAVPGGLLFWLAFPVIAGGAALMLAGIQRARFRKGGGGPGIVTIVEGRVGYFGPVSGGVVDLEDLVELSLDGAGASAHWHLRQPGQPPLEIPVNAEGADRLFDAFASLPGMRTEHMLRQLQAPGGGRVVIWQAPQARRHAPRLH